MRKAVGIAAVVVWLASTGFSQQSSITLSGGFGRAAGGDLTASIKGTSDYRRDVYGASGSLVPSHLGMNFNLEFMYHFTPNFGLGMGFGFFQTSKSSGPSTFNISTPDQISLASVYSITPKVSAVPITLNFHYFLPVGSKLNFDLQAGFGYYVTVLDFRSKDALKLTYFGSSLSWTEDFTFQSTRGGVGVQAGVGFELEVAPRVALVLNAFGRYASISGFKGSYTYKESGDTTANENGSGYTFWFFDEKLDSKTYSQYDFFGEKPDWEGISNVREGKIDLTGFGATLGLRIKF